MFHRYLAQAVLILIPLVGVGTLAGCGGNHGGKVTLQKTLGPGGRRTFGKSALDQTPTGRCLNLADQLKSLRAETNGLAVHARDYDLGTIAATPKDHRVSFNSVTNALDLELRARRALTGENAPISLASAKPGDLLDARPLVDVLGIAAQDDCRSVKFKSGVTFTVEHGDQTSLNLINPVTREQREYIWSKQSLIINVFAPVELKACDGRVSTAKFERISLRLTFGEQFGQVKLVPAYARILDVPADTSSIVFQEKIKTAAARAEALTCPR